MKKEELKEIIKKKIGNSNLMEVEVSLEKLKEIEITEYQRWIDEINGFEKCRIPQEDLINNGKILYIFRLNASYVESYLKFDGKLFHGGRRKFWYSLDSWELEMYRKILEEDNN